jgi:hypothetical protein
VLKALSKAAFDRDVGRIDPRSARMYDWMILKANYPALDVLFNHPTAAPLRLRFECTDWDELPPSIEMFMMTLMVLQEGIELALVGMDAKSLATMTP